MLRTNVTFIEKAKTSQLLMYEQSSLRSFFFRIVLYKYVGVVLVGVRLDASAKKSTSENNALTRGSVLCHVRASNQLK